MNYKSRVEKVRALTLKNTAHLITDPNDIFYLSGFSGTFARIIITPSKAIFLTDFRYKGTVEELGLSGIFEIMISKKPLSDTVKLLKNSSKILFSKTVSFESYELFKNKLKRPVEPSGIVRDLRLIKDADEVSLIKKSASLTEAGIKHMVSIMKPGITEQELALEFEFFIRKNGADSVSFPPIIAFNANAAIPHHTLGTAKLAKNTLVLMDVGARYRGYCSDLTRMAGFDIIQPHLKEVKKHYNMVKTAKDRGVSLYRTGLAAGKADRQVREYFKKSGVERFFTHSLGHGTGIEIHEDPYVRPLAKDRFKPGMVVTCEPGIYFENKYGIRIEDDYLITDNTAAKLSEMDDNLILL